MSNLYTISVNEHILVATQIPRVAEVGERTILEMARNRFLPAFGHPSYRIARNEPFIEVKTVTVGDQLLRFGQLDYAVRSVPSVRASWDSPVLPLVFTVKITDKVMLMLDELNRTLRENLKVFV